jgi:hypothetical protein
MKKPKSNLQNKTDLAGGLGISRTTLDRYLQMPGAPTAQRGKYDAEAVARWIRDNAESQSSQSRVDPEISQLRARELRAKCERLEFKLAQDRDDFIPRAKLGPALDNAHLAMRTALQRKFENEIGPKLPILRPEDQMAEIRAAIDFICETFNSNLKQWYQSKTN